jgi:hypothetical protein
MIHGISGGKSMLLQELKEQALRLSQGRSPSPESAIIESLQNRTIAQGDRALAIKRMRGWWKTNLDFTE